MSTYNIAASRAGAGSVVVTETTSKTYMVAGSVALTESASSGGGGKVRFRGPFGWRLPLLLGAGLLLWRNPTLARRQLLIWKDKP